MMLPLKYNFSGFLDTAQYMPSVTSPEMCLNIPGSNTKY